MAALPFIAAAASIAGTAISAYGTIAGGKANRQAADFQARQYEEKAGLERDAGTMELAKGQVEASQYQRRKELALSRGQAVAAASGFSATDPTALALADETERYGTLQEKMAVSGGLMRRAAHEAQGRNYDAMALTNRWEGEAAQKASKWKAAGTILGGISNLAMRFNPQAQAQAEESPFRYGSNVLAYERDPASGWRTTTRHSGAYG
jgi:hypothetical protein